MTDQKDAAFVFFESTFQSLLCIHIQMVGGLIQEQDIGVTVDQLAKPYLGLFSTAQDAYLAFDVLCGKSAFSQCGTDLILCVGRKILPELFDTGGTVVAFHFLFKIADLEIFSQFARTGKSRNQSEDTF